MRGVFLLFLVGLSCGDITFRDATDRETPPIEIFSDDELKCFLKDKVLHSDGKCYRLKQTGPCVMGEWLVIDKTNTGDSRRLVCKELPCGRPLSVFWVEDGQCHRRSDRTTLCPYLNNVLGTDSYGDGECACDEKHVRLKADILKSLNTTLEWEGDCHPLYKRGSCPVGKVIFPTYMRGHGIVGECKTDPCARDNARDPTGGFVKYPQNDRCYQLGTRGPCPVDQLLNVHPLTNTPQCYNLVNVVTGGVARCGGEGNIDLKSDECRKEIIVNMEISPFVTVVSGGRRKRRAG